MGLLENDLEACDFAGRLHQGGGIRKEAPPPGFTHTDYASLTSAASMKIAKVVLTMLRIHSLWLCLTC